MFFHILRFLASLGMTALFVFLVLARHLVIVQLLAIVMPRHVVFSFCPVIPNPGGVRNLII